MAIDTIKRGRIPNVRCLLNEREKQARARRIARMRKQGLTIRELQNVSMIHRRKLPISLPKLKFMEEKDNK